MIEITPPQPLSKAGGPALFLAGSIEMGVAERWQERTVDALKDREVTIWNPRRPDWDSSWAQTSDNPKFVEQVSWELDGLYDANIIAFYFDPVTKSPITLMELGTVLGGPAHFRPYTVVCCPEGFWRKGNVDIICQREIVARSDSGVVLVNTYEDMITQLRKWI